MFCLSFLSRDRTTAPGYRPCRCRHRCSCRHCRPKPPPPPLASCLAGCRVNFFHAAMSHLSPLLAALLPLILPLSPLLSVWLLCHHSSCRHIPCQCLSLHRCLSFLRSRASCPAGCRIDSPWRAGRGRRITWGRRLLLSPSRCLLLCCSCTSCLVCCCVASPHVIASPACTSASHCAITSRSAALAPLACHRRRTAIRWLIVALLSAIRFCHHMPSCDRQCSRCWPLSPIIVFHRRHRHHRRHCCCCRAVTTAITITVAKLTIVQ